VRKIMMEHKNQLLGCQVVGRARPKNKKQRIWYDEKRENPHEQFGKKLCFLDVSQFRRALLTFHISQNRNYTFHRNCLDRIIAICTNEECPFSLQPLRLHMREHFV
jgi:hypothetical protein